MDRTAIIVDALAFLAFVIFIAAALLLPVVDEPQKEGKHRSHENVFQRWRKMASRFRRRFSAQGRSYGYHRAYAQTFTFA